MSTATTVELLIARDGERCFYCWRTGLPWTKDHRFPAPPSQVLRTQRAKSARKSKRARQRARMRDERAAWDRFFQCVDPEVLMAIEGIPR